MTEIQPPIVAESSTPEPPEVGPRRGGPSLATRLLAELAVIVLGVLIALWADGWVADRADRRVEASRVEALRDNVVATRTRLVEAREEATDAAEALQEIARWTSPDQAIEEGGTVLRGMFFGPAFTPELNVYADLKNSGDLALLRNVRLRQALANMDANLELLALLQNDVLTVQQLQYDTFLVEQFALVGALGPYLGLEDLPEDPIPTPDLRRLRNLALFKLDLVSELMRVFDRVEASLDEVQEVMNADG